MNTRRVLGVGLTVVGLLLVGFLALSFFTRDVPSVVVNPTLKAEELITRGSSWRFIDPDAPLGQEWKEQGFDDSAWSEGSLTFPASSGKTFLRRAFNIERAEEASALYLQLPSEGRCGAFLNGMDLTPDDSVDGRVRSVVTEGVETLTVPPQWIRDGRNTLAVALCPATDRKAVSFDAWAQISRKPSAKVQGPPWIIVTAAHSTTQSSGAAVDGDGLGLWFHEDYNAANPGAVYRMEPNGTVRAWIRFASAEGYLNRPVGTVDPEGMAIAGGQMYIADTGNAVGANKDGVARRPYYTITRFDVPDPTELAPGENEIPNEQVQQVRFTYGHPDWIWRDGEAFIVDPISGDMLVIEKRADTKARTGIYRIPAEWGNRDPVVAPEVGKLAPGIVGISDAAVAPDGRSIWLRNGTHAYRYVVPPGDTAIAALVGEPTDRIELPRQIQGEGLTVDPSGDYLIVTSEGERQAVWGIPIRH